MYKTILVLLYYLNITTACNIYIYTVCKEKTKYQADLLVGAKNARGQK